MPFFSCIFGFWSTKVIIQGVLCWNLDLALDNCAFWRSFFCHYSTKSLVNVHAFPTAGDSIVQFCCHFQYRSTDGVLPNEFKESLVRDETDLTASKNSVENLDAIETEFCENQHSQF